MRTYISVEAEVCVGDILDELDHDELLDELTTQELTSELESRGYVVTRINGDKQESSKSNEGILDRDNRTNMLIRAIEQEAQATESMPVRHALHWAINQIKENQ